MLEIGFGLIFGGLIVILLVWLIEECEVESRCGRLFANLGGLSIVVGFVISMCTISASNNNNNNNNKMVPVEQLEKLGFEIDQNIEDRLVFASYRVKGNGQYIEYLRSKLTGRKEENWDEYLSVGKFNIEVSDEEYLTTEEIETLISYFK